MKQLITIFLATLSLAATAQDVPTDIAKKDLPGKGNCLLCPSHGEEKLAGGVMYKGKAYYFCNTTEIKTFKKDPEAYISPVLPRAMPSFEVKDTAGKTWNADSMKGKLVLVDFWASWCKPCIAMMPMLDKVHAKFSASGFEILSVSIDEKKPDLDKFLKGHKFPNPVLHDTVKTWQKWGIRAIPATFLIKDGQIVAQWTGAMKEKELAVAIEAALGRLASKIHGLGLSVWFRPR